MKASRTVYGVAATLVWLATAAALLYVKRDSLCTLKVNEWGDFFAGAVAPIAFLWLVLGYMQQGDELRTSSAELKKQANALIETSAAQRALVETERERILEERAVRELEVRPNLHLQGTGSRVNDSGQVEYDITLTNLGGAAVSLECVLHLDGGQERRTLMSVPLLARGNQLPASLQLPPRLLAANAQLRISFSDALSRQHSEVFSIGRMNEQAGTPLIFSRQGQA